MEIKKILACVDSSEYSTAVMRFSSYFAKKLGSELVGLHVIDVIQLEGPMIYDISGAIGLEPFIDFSAKVKAALEAKGKNILESFKTIAGEFGVNFSYRMPVGVVANEILSASEDFDVVFIGRKGVNEQYERGILGSNIESVIRKIEKPLFVSPKHFYTFDKVVVCVDGREISKKAFEYATFITNLFGVEIKAVFVKKSQETPQFEYDVDIVEAESVVAGLETYISQFEKPLVIMGAYARPKLLEILLGSTTEALLKRDLEYGFLLVR